MVDGHENLVELVHLDCYNELYPSDANCAGAWRYWYERTGYTGNWQEDESLSLYCIGNLIPLVLTTTIIL